MLKTSSITIRSLVKAYLKKVSKYFFNKNQTEEHEFIKVSAYRLFDEYFYHIKDDDDIFKETNYISIISIVCFWLVYKFCIDDDVIHIDEICILSKASKTLIQKEEIKIYKSIDFKILKFLS